MNIIKRSFINDSGRKNQKERRNKIILKYEHMIGIETKIFNEFKKIKRLFLALIDKYQTLIPAVDKILISENTLPYVNIRNFKVDLWLFTYCPETRIKNFNACINHTKTKKYSEHDLTNKEILVLMTCSDVENGIYRQTPIYRDMEYYKELSKCVDFYEKLKQIFMSLEH